MAKQKFYAVKKGHKTGIFYTWEDCLAATKGFSAVEYKSFETEEEASAYLNGQDIVYDNEIAPRLSAGKVVAFVDGSFNAEKSTYGFGVYILTPSSKTPIEISGKSSNPDYVELRNISGEILGSVNAIDWAWKNGFESVSIFHDYEGIGKWASGEWKTNKSISRFYKSFIDDKKDIINIEFVKVSGHSNNKYNDRVDALAKASVNDNQVLKDSNGSGGYIINHVSKEQIFSLAEQLKMECEGLDYTFTEQANKGVFIVTQNREKVTLTVFNNIKLLVQGRKTNLFHLITTSIIEKLDNADFLKILKDAYEKTIKKDELDARLVKHCPNLAGAALPSTIEKLLKQSIVDLDANGYGDIEFSKYTLAVLRALEGVLKYNLSKYSINIAEHGFNVFDKDDGIYVLQAGHKNRMSSTDAQKIENCYNFYCNNRNTLCHFGYVIAGVDTNTRLIDTKVDANSIILSALQIINDNYIG